MLVPVVVGVAVGLAALVATGNTRTAAIALVLALIGAAGWALFALLHHLLGGTND
jgi:hypothetical protein